MSDTSPTFGKRLFIAAFALAVVLVPILLATGDLQWSDIKRWIAACLLLYSLFWLLERAIRNAIVGASKELDKSRTESK